MYIYIYAHSEEQQAPFFPYFSVHGTLPKIACFPYPVIPTTITPTAYMYNSNKLLGVAMTLASLALVVTLCVYLYSQAKMEIPTTQAPRQQISRDTECVSAFSGQDGDTHNTSPKTMNCLMLCNLHPPTLQV